MAAQSTSALQDTVLRHVRDNNIEIMMFLVNGVRLLGRIKRFDNFTVELVRGSSSQIVYKHAISSIQPVRTGRVRAGGGNSLTRRVLG